MAAMGCETGFDMFDAHSNMMLFIDPTAAEQAAALYPPDDKARAATGKKKPRKSAADNKEGKQTLNCPFFVRTGACAYGEKCKFNHPAEAKAPELSLKGYPLREGEPICPHYARRKWCAFGETCKFNHPESMGFRKKSDGRKADRSEKSEGQKTDGQKSTKHIAGAQKAPAVKNNPCSLAARSIFNLEELKLLQQQMLQASFEENLISGCHPSSDSSLLEVPSAQAKYRPLSKTQSSPSGHFPYISMPMLSQVHARSMPVQTVQPPTSAGLYPVMDAACLHASAGPAQSKSGWLPPKLAQNIPGPVAYCMAPITESMDINQDGNMYGGRSLPELYLAPSSPEDCRMDLLCHLSQNQQLTAAQTQQLIRNMSGIGSMPPVTQQQILCNFGGMNSIPHMMEMSPTQQMAHEMGWLPASDHDEIDCMLLLQQMPGKMDRRPISISPSTGSPNNMLGEPTSRTDSLKEKLQLLEQQMIIARAR